ncbi:MAG TPA: hypothetical protein VI603_02925 [Saprospiraceae bacterium]|nr:hypothetical protein [Saprospiraceae bacterium]
MEETGKTEEAEEVEEAEELVAYGPKPACRMHGVRQVFIKNWDETGEAGKAGEAVLIHTTCKTARSFPLTKTS